MFSEHSRESVALTLGARQRKVTTFHANHSSETLMKADTHELKFRSDLHFINKKTQASFIRSNLPKELVVRKSKKPKPRVKISSRDREETESLSSPSSPSDR